MKKPVCLLLMILCLLPVFTACGAQTGSDPLNNPSDYVRLCDYDAFNFSDDDLNVSDSDAWLSVQMKLQSEGVEIEEHKDFTAEMAAKYYSALNADEAIAMVKKKTAKRRVCESAYEQLITGSMVKIPKEANEYAERILARQKENIGISSVKAIKEDLVNNYMEMIIVRAWAEKEKVAVSDSERDEMISAIAQSEEITPEDVASEYEPFVIEHYVLCEKLSVYFLKCYAEMLRAA